MAYLSMKRLRQLSALFQNITAARLNHRSMLWARLAAKAENWQSAERLEFARKYRQLRDDQIAAARLLADHLYEVTNDDDVIGQEYWEIEAEAWGGPGNEDDERVLWVRTENKSQLIEALDGTAARFRRIATQEEGQRQRLDHALDFYLPEGTADLRAVLLANRRPRT